MRTLALRRVDERLHARTQAVHRWQGAGHRAGLSLPPTKTGYLRFDAEGEQGDWQGLVLARDWLHHSLPQLASLLTVECSLMSIASLFRALPRPLPRTLAELHYERLAGIELLDAHRLPPQALPRIDTEAGPLWVTVLPPAHRPERSSESRSWLSDLPLRLHLILGASHISRSSRSRLAQGDVLRIDKQTHQCWLANRRIGVFSFTKEGLHMELTVDDSSRQADCDAVLEQLPVRLEFVLATHDIDLGTLQNIIAGQLVPLPTGTEMHIEVRAHGKSVARGELVQLDGHMGVELLEVYRNSTDE